MDSRIPYPQLPTIPPDHLSSLECSVCGDPDLGAYLEYDIHLCSAGFSPPDPKP